MTELKMFFQVTVEDEKTVKYHGSKSYDYDEEDNKISNGQN